MCSIVCDGRCRPVKSSSTGVVKAARFVGGAAWLTARYVAWPTTVVAYRWVSGAPMLKDARPVSRPAWLVRVRWSQWPRWQRSMVRLAFTALVVAGYLAPLLTALSMSAAVGATTAAVVTRRRRLAASTGPLRVTVKVGPAITDRQTAGVR